MFNSQLTDGSVAIQLTIPKIKVLCNLPCVKARLRLRCKKLGTLRFHNVSHEGNVHIQYPVIISDKRAQPSINKKLKALYE